MIDTPQSDWPDRVRERSGKGVQVVIDQVGGSRCYVSVRRNDGSRTDLDSTWAP
ncbi:hypothetical protein C2W62_27445 [Candidatus Entotheonella serta]|nr:hypothetical protein C2W62_27445 [Candidatus Entotheonella serta]